MSVPFQDQFILNETLLFSDWQCLARQYEGNRILKLPIKLVLRCLKQEAERLHNKFIKALKYVFTRLLGLRTQWCICTLKRDSARPSISINALSCLSQIWDATPERNIFQGAISLRIF